MERFYITSPIYYPNARPHLGHAYTTLLCDTLARYHKRKSEETYFLTGTDENSEKIIHAAQKAGEEPNAYLETNVQRFKDLYAELGIEYSQFIRTSDKTTHWPGAIEMWKRLSKAGALYKASYSGLYCVGHEAFLTEKELDEKGFCPDHGMAPERITEENWFFKLTEYGAKIEQEILAGRLPITPETRKNEVLAFLRSGVEDVSFSRPATKMTWGIPVPDDEAQKMYVWIDALSNYISALGFGREDELMRFWPGTHVLGKDILRFHAVFWPAMLMAANLPLPKQLFVHGTITSGGKKMSKTLGNVIDPHDLIKRYGPEATRYLLLRHTHPFEDTDITWERLDEWYTANLVNGLGNLVARVLQMASQYLTNPVDLSDRKEAYSVKQWLEKFEFHSTLNALWSNISHLDGLINDQKPFEVFKTEKERARLQVTYLVKELSRLGEALEPFLPQTSNKIHKAILTNKKPENLFPRLPTRSGT